MSTQAIPPAFRREVRFNLRLEIHNPQKFWFLHHDANSYVEERMSLFRDACLAFLEKHLPEDTFFTIPRDTKWFYVRGPIGGKTANYCAILQCGFQTFEDMLETVDALAPEDTIPMVVDESEQLVEIVWPNRTRQQDFSMDLWDQQADVAIVDPSMAKAALEATGLHPTKVTHKKEQWGGDKQVTQASWITTMEVDNLAKIEPIEFMFGDRSLKLTLHRITAVHRQMPFRSGRQALAEARADYAESKNPTNYREALMTNQAMYPSTPTKRSRTVLFSNASQRGMDRRRPSPEIQRKSPPQTAPIPIQPPEPSLLQEDAIHAQELQEIADCLEQNPELMDDL